MEKIKECKICNNVYNYQCGEFSNHIQKEHGLSREQYIVITEYNNVHPKCQCGYCEDDATFLPRKNSFHDINDSHRGFDWLQDRFIEKFGAPVCKTCGKQVKFNRGVPNSYCSPSCVPGSWNQEQVKKTVLSRYGVDNVMQIGSVKEKVKNKAIDSWKNDKEERITKVKRTKLEKYGDENYMNLEKMKETTLKNHGVEHYSQTDKYRKDSSDRIKILNLRIESGEVKQFNTRQFKDTSLHYQSSYEFIFLELCETNNLLQFITNSKGFHYLKEDEDIGNRHLPDFLFKERYIIEIKSTYILEKQGGWSVVNAKKRSVESAGYEYILVIDNNFTPFNELLKSI